MENFDNLVTETEMGILREGIKTKYKHYQTLNRSRFPDLDYNTNRANYIPLRESFDEEFYMVRGIDRTSPNIHIPSTNTLALLFTEDRYVPGKKILNTCRSYAEGKSGTSVTPAISSPIHPEPATTNKTKWLAVAGLVLLAGLVIVFAVSQWFAKPAASGLVIERPTAQSTVLQELIVEGKVVNAETVWLVVRHKKSPQYWVQPAVKVQDNGWWISVVYIGGVGNQDDGLTYQVRAFVNPIQPLTSGKILTDWPRAELSTGTMEVVRGSKLD